MVTDAPALSPELTAFDDYLRFGTDEEQSKGEHTRQAYLYTITVFRRFLNGRPPTPDLAKQFIKTMEERGNAATSVNRHIWALKSYFRYLVDKNADKTLEFKIRGLKTVQHYPRFLRDKEWDLLLEQATAPIYDPEVSDAARYRAKKELALLYAYCGGGLRLSEALQLTDTDIFDEGFVRVIRKGGHEDFVPIEDEVLRAFKDWKSARGESEKYLFPGKEPNTPMAPRTAQGIIKALCRRAGLEDVHVHSLRHTAGYQLRKGGASERDIQDVLGHRNIATTQIYTHLVSEDLKRRLPKRFTRGRQGHFDLSGLPMTS